jgi:DNA-binding transcriptional MerR regulator
MSDIEQLSEEAAASACGVSAATLSRFVETGYLQVETSPAGSRTYSATELRKVFGIPLVVERTSAEIPAATATATASEDQPDSSTEPNSAEFKNDPLTTQCSSPSEQVAEPAGSGQTVASTDVKVAATESNEQPIEQPEEELLEASSEAVSTSEAPASEIVETIATVDVNASADSRQAAPQADNVALHKAAATTQTIADTGHSGPVTEASATIHSLETENQRLTALVSMYEKLLDIREAELADIKNDRDWLRKRVERLEDKADRDQLLLLSETQMIARFLASKEEKKGAVTLALEWLGFKRPEDSQDSSTINHK